MLPDGIHVRTEDVARYFEIHRDAVHSVVKRHRDELQANGLITLKGSELQSFHVAVLATWDESYPQASTRLRLYTRRTVLNIAMLLRDSDIARCVRTYLLDAEEEGGWHQGYASLDRRVTRVEANLDTVGHLRSRAASICRAVTRLENQWHRSAARGTVVESAHASATDATDRERSAAMTESTSTSPSSSQQGSAGQAAE